VPEAIIELEEHRGRPAIVGHHPYREQIEELLCAGWSTRTLNQRLSAVFPDYVPVSPWALNRYRRTRLQHRLRPMEEYERRLRDEHVLLDPIRSRAALIILQQARVAKAIQLEDQLTGVVLSIAGTEISRLAGLWDHYEASLERMGFVRHEGGEVVINAPTQIKVIDELEKQMAEFPDHLRAQFADALRHAREARAKARMGEVEERVRASLPDTNEERIDRKE
jgi:hypothetical protein